MHRGVAKEHVGIGVPFQRFVLRKPFVEPEGELERNVIRNNRLNGSAVKHVVDDGMRQLVVDHVTELGILPLEGEDDAVLEKLCAPADPLFQVFADDIRLLKIVVRIVHDDGDAVHELVTERLAERGVGGFGGSCGEFRQVLSPVGEVDIEMVRLYVGPVESRVLHLVLPELLVLSAGGPGCKDTQYEGRRPAYNGPIEQFHTPLT